MLQPTMFYAQRTNWLLGRRSGYTLPFLQVKVQKSCRGDAFNKILYKKMFYSYNNFIGAPCKHRRKGELPSGYKVEVEAYIASSIYLCS